jgi:hypothetical protein
LPPARLAALVCLVLATALLAAGCGGGGGTTTVIEKTVTETNGGEEAGTTGEGANGGGGVSPERAEESLQTLHLSSFQSPSGNIGCVLLDGNARCDIAKRSWKPPPRPPGCPDEVDFGQGLQVNRDDESGNFVCAGDTTLNPEAPKLGYGSADRFGGLFCESATAGVTCENAGGHGFFISIQSYRTF